MEAISSPGRLVGREQELGRLEELLDELDAGTGSCVAVEGEPPHYLFWSLFELAWANYFAGRLDTAIAACEESLQVGGRMTGGTMPSAGGGPGWALAACRLESGHPAAMLETVRDLGDDDLDWAIPVEKCSTGRASRSRSLRWTGSTRPRPTRPERSGRPEPSSCTCRRPWRPAPGRRSCSPPATHRRRRSRRSGRSRARAPRAPGFRRRSRAACTAAR